MQTGTTIYMDYQASTPLDPQVSDAINIDQFANPHSTGHALGQQAADLVEQGIRQIEAFINASAEEVIITSGATESNNQAIATVVFANNNKSKNTILISEIEHKCIKNAAYFFAEKLGYQVKEIPVKYSGQIDTQAYRDLLTDEVLLVCIMAVNNEIGTIQNIKSLCQLAHDVGALFHCDAAQAPEAIDIDVKNWDVDMLSLSAHKIYGPKGIGALYIKERLQATLPPLIQGGGQQYGMRSGTIATPLVVGFAKALDLAKQYAPESRVQLNNLKDRFIQRLQEAKINFRLNGDQANRHPGNINLEFAGINNVDLINQIQPYVSASTGSACNSEMVLISHVLKAIGLTDEQALSSIRFSIGRFTTEEQINQASQILIEAIQSLKTNHT